MTPQKNKKHVKRHPPGNAAVFVSAFSPKKYLQSLKTHQDSAKKLFDRFIQNLLGGFNPLEKYSSKWESSPKRDENRTYLKPPPRKLRLLTELSHPLHQALNVKPHLESQVIHRGWCVPQGIHCRRGWTWVDRLVS